MFRKKHHTTNRKPSRSVRFETLENRDLLSVNISEVHFRPSLGTSIEDEYLEIRGDANAIIPANTFFISVESDGDEAFDIPGKINSIFDLSGLTLGANGYIAFTQQNASFSVDPLATSLQGTTGGFKGMPGGVYQGFTGQFESLAGSETFLIVDTSAGSAPVLSSDIDGDDDGVIDPSNNWAVLDSVTYLKEDSSTITGDLAYGDIVFRGENNNSTVPVSATLVDMDEVGYVARIHDSTGYEVDHWLASGTKETNIPFVFEVSDGDNGKPSPGYYAGKLLDHIGADNFFAPIRGDAPPGYTVYVDRDNNGLINDYQLSAEPDDAPPTSLLINAFPGVTLTGAGPTHEPSGWSITSGFTGSNSSTGSYSFSYSGITQFSDFFQMRMDFLQPAGEVSIDFSGGSSSGDAIGTLKAFDANDMLVASYTTSLLALGVTETMSISRTEDDIAYAVAFVDPTSPKKAGYLDNLLFEQPEEQATVDGNGDYLISPVLTHQNTILVKSFFTAETEAVKVNDLPATHVDFAALPGEREDVFGRSSDGSLNIARPSILVPNSFEFENWGSFFTGVAWDDILVADVNGDGRDDVVGRTEGGQWWVAQSDGATFTNTYWGKWSGAVVWEDVVVGDFNGDGMDDIAGRTNGQWWLAKSQGTFFTIEYWGTWSNAVTWDDVVVGDFDGDGKDDIAGRTSGQWWISHSQGTYFTVEYWGKWSNAVTWNDVNAGDFDGDGKTDIAGRTSGQWWISHSQGTYFTVEYWGSWSNAVTWDDVMVADVNGDSQSDIVGRTNDAWWVSRSNGNFFTVEYWGNWSSAVTWEQAVIADLNGDSMDDIVGVTGGTWWATESQGSYFSAVLHWGNHPDSVNWMHVQSAEFGTPTEGSSLPAADQRGSNVLPISASIADEIENEKRKLKRSSAVARAKVSNGLHPS